MSKYEAVDRLMALATEKRADRIAPGVPVVAKTIEAEERPGSPAVMENTKPADSTSDHQLEPRPSAAARGRQMFEAIRPLLPAVAGAMRLVDHGAVQAIARLLPLLGGSQPGSQKAPVSPEQEKAVRLLLELQHAQQAVRLELDAMTLKAAASDDLLARTRTHLERLAAEQSTRESEFRALTDRVRLLSAGSIILLMLVVAQIILMVVMLHR